MFTLDNIVPKKRPKFLLQLNFPKENFPFRAYVHGNCKSAKIHMEELREYFVKDCKTAQRELQNMAQYNWGLGIFWMDQGNHIMDVLAYKLSADSWPVNAELKPFIIENGSFKENHGIPTCEDGIIVLSQEALYRRTTPNLKIYSEVPPKIPEIGIIKENCSFIS